MQRLLDILVTLPRRLFIGLLRAYQLVISPHTPPTCRFHPTCSTYSIEAFREYGVFKGLILTVYRLGRCHPWGGHGYDPPRWFGQPPPEKYRTHSTEVAGSTEVSGGDPVPVPEDPRDGYAASQKQGEAGGLPPTDALSTTQQREATE